MSAPTFILKSAASTSNASPHTQNYMGSIVAGDFLILVVFTNQEAGGSPGDIDVPAGWALLGGGVGYRDSSLNNVGSFRAFYKIATGSESGSVSLTISGSSGGSNLFYSQMYQFRGSPRVLLESVNSELTGDGDSTIVYQPVTVAGHERTLIALTGQNSNPPGTPSGYANEAQDSSGGIIAYLHLDVDENVSSDGLVNASNGDADGWATIHLSIFSPKGRNYIVNVN